MSVEYDADRPVTRRRPIVTAISETTTPEPVDPKQSSSALSVATPVIVVEHTQNKKVGPVATTYASQATCPSSCPFLKGNGCYAETGPCSFTTRRLNSSPVTDPDAIAQMEADLIDGVRNKNGLRVHTVGDCTTSTAALLVGEAMARYQDRTGGRAWTYTHSWRDVPVSAWGVANVLASCENTAQVREAREDGYATCMTVAAFISKQAYWQDGVKIVPCPEQTVGTTCTSCRMCFDVGRLNRAGITIAFAPHGNKAKKVREVVEELASPASFDPKSDLAPSQAMTQLGGSHG